ncbi:MAG: PfkB family carbohydrate kinase [Butyrivibrio sp.]|jgi:ribokinase|nr:PfkB family carbohydrate kinase [Butyrivibrio sp.]
MGKFVVAGVTQIETIVKVEKIPVEFAPLTRGTGTIYTSVGGDAYNESLALKWLGNEVTFMSMVGRSQKMDQLNPGDRKVTIPTEYIIPQMENTPTEVIFYDKNRRQQIFEDPKDLHDAVYDMSMATPLVAACDMVILANANFCKPFLRLAREHCKRIAVNVRNFNHNMEKIIQNF